MLPDQLPSIITPVVRDSAALVARLPRALDSLALANLHWRPFVTAGQSHCSNRSFPSRKASMVLMQTAGYSKGRK